MLATSADIRNGALHYSMSVHDVCRDTYLSPICSFCTKGVMEISFEVSRNDEHKKPETNFMEPTSGDMGGSDNTSSPNTNITSKYG
jgi:hypothetical protein